MEQPRGPQFHRGSIPEGRLRLAEYLYYSGRISWRTLVDAIAWQRAQRPTLGRIAVDWGHLNELDVREVLASRRRDRAHGVLFGEQAVRCGLITPRQLLALVGRQRFLQRRIGEYFVDFGFLRPEEIPEIRLAIIRHNLGLGE